MSFPEDIVNCSEVRIGELRDFSQSGLAFLVELGISGCKVPVCLDRLVGSNVNVLDCFHFLGVPGM